MTEGLLGSNIAANEASIHGRLLKAGSVAVQALDWMDDPASWLWPNGEKYGPPFDLIVTSDSSGSRLVTTRPCETVEADNSPQSTAKCLSLRYCGP